MCLVASEATKLNAATETKNFKVNEDKAFTCRMGFGVFANDMRQEPLPLEPWPTSILDDETVAGVISVLDVQSQNGYNMIDIAGLFPMAMGDNGWPVDFTKVADQARITRINQIVDAAHQRGIRVICLQTGVLASGFQNIIRHDPGVKGTSEFCMCPAKEKSWVWMDKIYDYVIDNFNFDGFHLESADRGRCLCEECKKNWPLNSQYHSYVTSRAAQYVRGRAPKSYLATIIFGWTTPKVGFTSEDIDQIVKLGDSVDIIFDQGHQGLLVPRQEDIDSGLRTGYPRELFVKRLQCNYGTSGGVWNYPPHRWDRTSWFLPYTKRTAEALKEQYDVGARGCLFYQGPVANPGTEMNIAFSGRILADPGKDYDQVLAEVIEDIYKPENAEAEKKLAEIFQRAEEIYFSHWRAERVRKSWGIIDSQHEFYMDSLFGTSPGPAGYLEDLYLGGPDGRLEYKTGLVSILKDLEPIENSFDDNGRIEKIKRSIIITLTLINTFAQGRSETKVYRD